MTARFAPGDRVRVRWAHPPGHIRTPYYVRGKTGVIERICGSFRNPEELAYARDGQPVRPLYRVHFDQGTLWPDDQGRANDGVEVEIFEHWLEPAGAAKEGGT